MNAIWKAERDERTGWQYTAATIYKTNGYRIWKGKYRVVSCLYSADKWHIEREADHKIIWSANTAKQCKKDFDFARQMAGDC